MIVLWTAVLIFVATLGFIGYSIYTSQYNISWPPSIPDCPDYWSSDGTNCTYGSYNKCGTVTKFPITTYTKLCDKHDFAKSNNCNWSGVSNSLICKS